MENLWSPSYAVKLCVIWQMPAFPKDKSSPSFLSFINQFLQSWLTIMHKIQLHASFISLSKVCPFFLIFIRNVKTLVSDMIHSHKGGIWHLLPAMQPNVISLAFPLPFQPTGVTLPHGIKIKWTLLLISLC